MGNYRLLVLKHGRSKSVDPLEQQGPLSEGLSSTPGPLRIRRICCHINARMSSIASPIRLHRSREKRREANKNSEWLMSSCLAPFPLQILLGLKEHYRQVPVQNKLASSNRFSASLCWELHTALSKHATNQLKRLPAC